MACVLALAGCSGGGEAATNNERTNTALCLDALALPITNAAQLFLNPDQLPEIRIKAYAVLDMTAPDADVTRGAHDVALKTVAVIDSAEALLDQGGDPLALLGSGLSGLAELSGPLQELTTAELALTESCLAVVGPSGIPTPAASRDSQQAV